MNFIEVFCGAGGLSTGLEMAGHTCVLGIDNDKSSCETFRRNHNAGVFCGDVRDFLSHAKKIKFPKIDLLAGGPPCQGFSSAGKGDPNDPRNFLFLEFLKIANYFKPEVILIENVRGLLAKKNIHHLQSIQGKLKSMGYNSDYRLLNACQYGVPQNRRRAIIIAKKSGNIDFPIPQEIEVIGDCLDYIKNSEEDLKHAKVKKEMDLKRVLYVPEGGSIRYEKDQKAYLPKELWFEEDFNSLPEKRFREAKFQRIDRKSVSPTITTSSTQLYHYFYDRHLTYKEASKLQSFPDDFVFYGSYRQKWKQIGNAVPPLLAKAVGECL